MFMEEEASFVKTQIQHHSKTAAWHGKNNRLDKQARHQGLHKSCLLYTSPSPRDRG